MHSTTLFGSCLDSCPDNFLPIAICLLACVITIVSIKKRKYFLTIKLYNYEKSNEQKQSGHYCINGNYQHII